MQRSPIPRRASLSQVYQEPTRTLVVQSAPQATRRHAQGSFLLLFGFGMFIMLGLYVCASSTLVPGYTRLYDQWQYGDSRVSHLRASVYPGKLSDIYAADSQGTAFVVVVTNRKVQAYAVPFKADSSVVLISLMDVNSDGKTDILLHDEQQTVSVVLINTGGGFRSQ
ncbi:MAG TPA: hypothetical protein VEU97_05685 [Ktedonobacteraceae bacterium]|nr:hypothetical protein [Ktedonobacteraceae bacterium]